jgi:hypothetical protein
MERPQADDAPAQAASPAPARQEADRLISEVGLTAAAAQRRVAGIIFTYRCTLTCRHCCFACRPDQPDKAMTPVQCAEALAMLHETGRVVHVAGGEAMMYWPVLAEALRLAHGSGTAPHFIETNCSFARDDETVRERFAFLAEHGVRGVLASSDPYHQEWVPADRFLRVRRIAREVFGERMFYGSASPDEQIEALTSVTKDEARLRERVRASPPVMVGAAHRELARFLDGFAPDDAHLPGAGWRGPRSAENCLAQFHRDTIWEIHLDPYDNIQTNCGIILGRTTDTRPVELLRRGPERANRFVELVCERGARGLAEFARREHGFDLTERVAQTCELCYLARRHLRRFYPDVFGPEEIYS